MAEPIAAVICSLPMPRELRFFLPVLLFEKMTGDKVDKFECAAIIAKEAFEKAVS